ncbi:glycosyltransferase family 4 protein [Burkholderia sp. L27(2015)]|uniref:MraY family glycosyltransferase n=1 Tax=Burkholderia sp. L27(2015) TaxID=1641858 RepID=UPI00131E195B|nr:glycosyltransferase family 4 protein [Burkholderia sp. L27(2015)]
MNGTHKLFVALLIALTGLLSWLVARIVMHNNVRFGLLAPPNERSSHVNPTPHGGGIGIALGGTAAGLALALHDAATIWILLGLALLIGVVGLIDDIRPLSARIRLVVQAMTCGALLSNLAPLPQLPLTAHLALGGVGLAALLIVTAMWWLNLFNFMDGIDGLAAMQAAFMLSVAAALAAILHPVAIGSALWCWMLALAAASVGFLLLNWPPARIFMGDVGSTYLAFMIFALALMSVSEGWLSYASWLVLGALFIVDATVTLVRRIRPGHSLSHAHRSHAYQRWSRRWGAHRPVTLLATAINALWLAPMAWLVLAQPAYAWLITLIAYAPLIIGVIILGAGKPDNA